MFVGLGVVLVVRRSLGGTVVVMLNASVLPSPILFAHRGARAYAPENTLDAFSLAVRMGATGIESDVWVSRDGVPVLDHDGVAEHAGQLLKVSDFNFADLPAVMPSLVQLLDLVGGSMPVALDLKDVAALDAVLDTIAERNPGRLWLCHHDTEVVENMCARGSGVQVVHSSRPDRMPDGPAVWVPRFAAMGGAAVNLRHMYWDVELVSLVHDAGLLAFGWDLQTADVLLSGFQLGLDAVFSDYTDVMVEVATWFAGS